MSESSISDSIATTSRRSGFARRQRLWLIGGGAVLVVLLSLWTERRPIATSVIDSRLARLGVTAHYRIAELGLGEQRLEHVVIGNPAHPDLVADWVTLDTRLGFDGATVLAVRAGHVRLRGKLVDGTLSLGSIDKLLPPSSGKPFTLPAIDLAVDDGRMRLETPMGVVGMRLTGSGKLDDGFAGDLAAVSERMTASGCTADRLAAVVKVHVAAAQPHFDGPIRAGRITCGTATASGVVIDQATTLGTGLDRWEGSARVRLAGFSHPAIRAQTIDGTLSYSGSAAQTAGKAMLAATSLAGSAGTARAARIDGNYRVGNAGIAFQGRTAAHLTLADRWRRAVAGIGTAAPGTPVAPLLGQLGKAASAAAGDLAVSGDVTLAMTGTNGSLAIGGLEARAASGAVMTLSGGDGVGYVWPAAAMRIDGLLAVSGGGLPDVALQVRSGANGAIRGTGIVRPYAAGTARLALDALDITAMPGGATRFATRALLSGPLGDGRIDGARIPLTGTWDGQRLAINPACGPVSADRVMVSGLDLRQPHLTLCPSGAALVTITGTRIGGGGRAADVALSGTLGGAPLTLAAKRAEFGLADRGFTLSGVATRLGKADAVTRLDIARLDGRLDGNALAGRFDGGAGQIANVPLLMSAGAGQWAFRDGRLSVDGALGIADAAPAPRFEPVDAKGVVLTLADNRITATGTLANPATGTALSDVRIVHDLGTAVGRADLTVPGVTFGTALRPDQLTALTRGVVADVKGTVSGEGHISWTGDTVTSDGVFTTKDTDLAAAFGPVKGLSTRIHFTDLLNMVSAPDQVATIVSINPGIAVENGIVHYALQKDQKVDVAGAEWPFAGGRLTLEPTLLDFTEHHERLLPFRLTGVDAAQFLQQFDFKNLDATGIFDGSLPMIFNERGGRIDNGHLTMRAGGGTIAYVGELSQKDLGFWGNMAFQSLKALTYRSLTIDMNGPLDGEVITDVHFAGISQGKGTKSNFLIKRLAHLPLVFNVRITAPFRQLLDSAQSFYDPSRLIQRNLPALIKAQEDAERQRAAGNATLPAPAPPIQPPESEKRP